MPNAYKNAEQTELLPIFVSLWNMHRSFIVYNCRWFDDFHDLLGAVIYLILSLMPLPVVKAALDHGGHRYGLLLDLGPQAREMGALVVNYDKATHIMQFFAIHSWLITMVKA